MGISNISQGIARAFKLIQIVRARAISHLATTSKSVIAPDLSLDTWIHELGAPPPLKGRVVLLAIRNPTWYEWAAYAACWLRKLGWGTLLLYSEKDIRHCYSANRLVYERLLVGRFDAKLASIPDIELINIEALSLPDTIKVSEYDTWALDYAHTVAAYDLRLEEHEGNPVREEYLRQVEKERSRLSMIAAAVEPVFRSLKEERGICRLIAYSGLIDSTPAYGEAARRCGWDVAFCEGWSVKPGHMICSINQPALVYDIKGWMRGIGEWDETRSREIEEFLRFQETAEVGGVEWLKDYHRFQRNTVDQILPENLLGFLSSGKRTFMLAPNCVGDSATLRARTIFRSQQEWIEKICAWFRERNDLRLIIRAHPDEPYLESIGKLRLRMGEVAASASEGAVNIKVIQGKEDVSTYSLFPHIQAGLVWMSTVGVDMVVRGLPVLAAARPKYSGLGIVHEPTSREEYFSALQRLVDKPDQPTPMQLEMGKKYLTILAREFSYLAFSPTYRGQGVSLAGDGPGGDYETFYRIVAGELPSASRPPRRSMRN